MDNDTKQIPNLPTIPVAQPPVQNSRAGLQSPGDSMKYFTDTLPLPEPSPRSLDAHGKTIIQRLWSLLIGGGNSVFASNIEGIWLGAKRWADAPFRVDMAGNLFASSVSILGGSLSGVTLSDYLALAGGTMLGFLTLVGDPVNALHAATKQYVDNKQTQGFTSIVVANDDVVTNNGEVVYNL